MPESGRCRYLIHLIRLDGSSLFLHPFTEHVSMVDVFSVGFPEGLYGQEPPVERIRMFRSHLHSIADHDAAAYALDTSFMRRFFVASIVFLAVYLPALVLAFGNGSAGSGALALAFLAAIGCYIVGHRRASAGAVALSKQTALRTRIDEIRFSYSEVVAELESVLHELEEATQEEILHYLRHRERERQRMDDGMPYARRGRNAFEDDLIACIEHRLRQSGALSVSRALERWVRSGDKRSLELASQRLSRRNVDLPLLALYWQLRQRTARPAQTV